MGNHNIWCDYCGGDERGQQPHCTCCPNGTCGKCEKCEKRAPTPPESSTQLAERLDAIYAAAKLPELTVSEYSEMVLTGKMADAYTDTLVGSIPELETMGNGETAFMTPERARAVAFILNAWPTISRMLRAGEAVEKSLKDFYDGECHCDQAIKPCVHCQAGDALAAYRAARGGGE